MPRTGYVAGKADTSPWYSTGTQLFSSEQLSKPDIISTYFINLVRSCLILFWINVNFRACDTSWQGPHCLTVHSMKIPLCLNQTQHLIPSLYCFWTALAKRTRHQLLHVLLTWFYTGLPYPSPHYLFFHSLCSGLIRFIWGVLVLPFQHHILKYPFGSLCFRNSFFITLH